MPKQFKSQVTIQEEMNINKRTISEITKIMKKYVTHLTRILIHADTVRGTERR